MKDKKELNYYCKIIKSLHYSHCNITAVFIIGRIVNV